MRHGSTIALLFAVGAILLCGCPEGGSDAGSDAGHDGGWDVAPKALEVELGVREDEAFVPMPGGSPKMEVVSGIQGGYHVEPALRIADPGTDRFISVVDYTVTDVDTGEVITKTPSSYRINERGWTPRPEGDYVRVWERVILDVLIADEAAGRTVRIDAEVEIEGGPATGEDSVTVELVDEVEELRGGGLGLHMPD